jgi:hypothetical protein
VETEVFVTSKGDFRAQLGQLNLHRLWMRRGWEALFTIFHSAVSAKPVSFGVAAWDARWPRHPESAI